MKFVYTPEGADSRSWDFNPDKLMNAEAEAIERHTGWTYPEFMEKFGRSSMLAIHALLYVFLKRSNPTLKWDAVQFSLSEVDMQLSDAEVDEAITELQTKQSADGLSSEEERGLADLLAGRGDRGPAPKDESAPISGPTTSSP